MFDLEPTITLPWLRRLRWALLVGQIAVWVTIRLGFGVAVASWPFVLSIVLLASSNLAISILPLRRFPPAHKMGAALVLDTAVLTVQLAALGGAVNPFSVMYLVYITLSAIVLSSRWTTVISALAIVGFALLFAVPSEHHIHHTGPALLDPHLQGMWIAFVIAAGLTAFFAQKISRAIAMQREQIVRLRDTAARNARHASLATLAAGAAHELNTPMSTIAVAAHEARLRVKELGDPSVAADLELILGQVERCQGILHQMAARVTGVDATRTVTADELVEEITDRLGESAARLDVTLSSRSSALAVPAAPVVQSIIALIKNALEASKPDDRVSVEIRSDGESLTVEVSDRGTGIPDEELAKVGEPFFTTKPPGRGLGLGVFLARSFFESHGGALAFESRTGIGTRVMARLPIGATT